MSLHILDILAVFWNLFMKNCENKLRSRMMPTFSKGNLSVVPDSFLEATGIQDLLNLFYGTEGFFDLSDD